ncbi:hypothetical protein CAEBREN_32037, partial [Caenorhabditis brenneri]
MSSAGDISEHTKRPRTPRGRYSPDAQRRTNSRLTMSALSIDTHRAADLNVDGSGPSSSSAASHVQVCSSSTFVVKMKYCVTMLSHFDDKSSHPQFFIFQFTPDPDRLPTSHRKKGPQSAIRSRKRRSPSVPVSQDDDDDSDTQDEETDDLPIVIDDLGYSITEEAREFFNRAKGDVAEEWHFSPKYLAEVYGSLKEGEQARLPEKMHFGKYIMRTWYGSPFPAEYIKVKMMYVCEFCMFYARSDEIMQNHAKKCEIRAPPGIEIYRRDNVSVFEVDGRKQKGYCQTLCLVSRMFLESKTVFYDTEPFFFYVVTMNDESVGRNLKLELPKIKVPEPIEGKEVTDEEDEKRKLQKKIKKTLTRCSDTGLKEERNREETPDDDQPGPSNKRPGRRSRSTRGNEEHMEPSSFSVSYGPKTPSSGKGRHRTRADGDNLQDTDGPTDSDRVSSDDDDDRPFGSTKGKNGKLHRGRRNGKRRKSVSGKKFPPNFGVRTLTEKDDEKKNGIVDSKPGPSEVEEKMEGVEEQVAEEPPKDSNTDAEKTAASDMEETHDYSSLHPTDEEITK